MTVNNQIYINLCSACRAIAVASQLHILSPLFITPLFFCGGQAVPVSGSTAQKGVV